MFQVPPAALLGLTLCILLSHKTSAQQFSGSGVVYEASRNKIGLIRYCRKNELLDTALADRAVLAMEAGVGKVTPTDASAREQGDLAQQAGEEGFWETGRKRDLAGVAKMFGTTPSDLCREWADETLRTQEPARSKDVTPIAVSAPASTPRPVARAEQAPSAPAEHYQPPARAAAGAKAVRSASPPPLPRKAPVVPIKAELAAVPPPPSRSGLVIASGRTLPSPIGGTRAATQPSGKISRLSDRLAEPAAPLPREQTAAAATPSRRLYEERPPVRENWTAGRFGRSDRCLLAGCKWPALQSGRARGY